MITLYYVLMGIACFMSMCYEGYTVFIKPIDYMKYMDVVILDAMIKDYKKVDADFAEKMYVGLDDKLTKDGIVEKYKRSVFPRWYDFAGAIYTGTFIVMIIMSFVYDTYDFIPQTIAIGIMCIVNIVNNFTTVLFYRSGALYHIISFIDRFVCFSAMCSCVTICISKLTGVV